MGGEREESIAARQVASAPALTTAASASPIALQILALQRTVGNRAVGALLAAAQPKLTVGAAEDPYEREADAVADEVLARLRSNAPPARSREEGGSRAGRSILSRLQRRAGPPAELPEVGWTGGDLDARAEAQIGTLRAGGSPLPTGVRRSMEGAFGADFGDVRVHRGMGSEELNRKVGAEAFTVGKDIFLGAGTRSLETDSGQRLLAHELTHTIQQEGAGHAQRLVLHRKPLVTSKLTTETRTRDATLKAITPHLKKGKVAQVDLGDKKTDPTEGDFVRIKRYDNERFKGVGYVRLEALQSMTQTTEVGGLKKGSIPTTQAPEDVDTLPGTDVVTSGTKVMTNVTKAVTKSFGTTSSQSDKTGLGSTITSEISDIFTIANTIRKWKESKGIDSWDLAIGGIGGAGGLVTGALELPTAGIKDVGGTVSTSVKDMGTDSGFVGAFLGDVVDVWKMFKSWWDTWHGNIEAKGAEQLARGTGDAITSALGAAQAFMTTAEKLLTTLGQSLGHLVAAIPGVGIAISALKIVLRGWDWVKAHVRFKESRDEKRTLKEKLGGKKGSKFSETDFMAELKKQTLTTGGTPPKSVKPSSSDTPKQAGLKAIFERYTFQKFLQKSGMKVMKRAGAEIGAEAVNIAGEIATLTGVGAVAGAALKGVSAGLKGVMAGARMIKKGLRETEFGKSIGFTGPTAKEKNAEYFKHATYILKGIEDVAKTPDEAGAKEDKARSVLGDLKKAGVRVKELKAAKDGDEQIQLITTAFKAR